MRRSFVTFAGALVTGCYATQPVTSNTLPLGTQVTLTINDAGRLALGGTMGPAIDRIEGRLVSREENAYVVAVSMLHLLRGGEQIWRGERVTIPTDHVVVVQERRFSRGRTAAVSAIAASAVVYLVTRSILGGGARQPDPSPIDSAETIRVVWP